MYAFQHLSTFSVLIFHGLTELVVLASLDTSLFTPIPAQSVHRILIGLEQDAPIQGYNVLLDIGGIIKNLFANHIILSAKRMSIGTV